MYVSESMLIKRAERQTWQSGCIAPGSWKPIEIKWFDSVEFAFGEFWCGQIDVPHIDLILRGWDSDCVFPRNHSGRNIATYGITVDGRVILWAN